MAAPSFSRLARPNCSAVQSDALLTFLVPSLHPAKASPKTSISRFSTSQPHSYPRDGNKDRGLSALRRTGLRPRQTLSVRNEPLPQPVLDKAKRSKVEVDPDHGLWQFFNKEKRILALPEEDSSHGRAWTTNELMEKSWEDLHALWWICCKERNRLATEAIERDRIQAGYGQYEADERDKTIKATMRAIRHALIKRWYGWEDARKVARDDPEVDLSGEGPAYRPRVDENYMESEEASLSEQNAEPSTGAAARATVTA